MPCLFGHKWNGCKCEKCGKIRNEEHQWAEKKGCYKICTICKTAEISHDFVSENGVYVCKNCNVQGFKWTRFPMYITMVEMAIRELGESVYDLPYLYRNLPDRLQLPEVFLDAHEIVCMHQLLTGLAVLLRQKSYSQLTKSSQEYFQLVDFFKFRGEIPDHILVLQRKLGIEGKEIVWVDTPENRERFKMYL
ncbi:MAG: hypothetical protein LBR25_00300 [Erysipelotrichaceae bacterium]|jgi:hypothetical protein|nr:hypothetical protein [Erysipelotrichaceae bacterium]